MEILRESKSSARRGNGEETVKIFQYINREEEQNLEAQHENVSPHWQDEMRRHYDAVWGPFLETMKHYVASEGPSYVEFLNIKIHALGRYLYG